MMLLLFNYLSLLLNSIPLNWLRQENMFTYAKGLDKQLIINSWEIVHMVAQINDIINLVFLNKQSQQTASALVSDPSAWNRHMYSLCTHNVPVHFVLTLYSQCPHSVLTMYLLGTHTELTLYSLFKVWPLLV